MKEKYDVTEIREAIEEEKLTKEDRKKAAKYATLYILGMPGMAAVGISGGSFAVGLITGGIELTRDMVVEGIYFGASIFGVGCAMMTAALGIGVAATRIAAIKQNLKEKRESQNIDNKGVHR